MLKEIGTANQHFAYRLLQCLAVAIRPLSVEELAEILALDFDVAKEGIPELKEDWRSNDRQDAILLTCSSLVSVVHDGSHHVVQFSHFSVKEFLTSDRLATSSADISHFHILPEPAHTVIAKGCLGILLQSNNGVDHARAKSNSPLAEYAAEHWVDHARFEKADKHIQVGMRRLFDLELPYFEAWLKLYDIDEGWGEFTVRNSRRRRQEFRCEERGSPLYYASLYGFRDLTAHLVAKHPQHVNAMLGRCMSPLVAALHKRHFDIAELLYQLGADVGIRGNRNWTLLHASSATGFVDIVRWLLDHCVDAHPRQDNHEAPLHLAEAGGHPGQRIIIDTVDDTRYTPLHLASLRGHFEIVRLLIKHGAEVTSQGSYQTVLHLASSSRCADTVRLLLEEGVGFNARYTGHTPLHLASSVVSAETVTLDPASADDSELDAKSDYRGDIVQVLIEHGADVTALDNTRATPLHLASSGGSAETMRVLIKHGADVSARNGSRQTPLHLASSSGSTETAWLLLNHGVDVNAQDASHNTPLHLASTRVSVDTA